MTDAPEMLILCPECDGEGIDLLNEAERDCPLCDGEGFVDDAECSCYGGTIWYHPQCPFCHGHKWVPNPEVVGG